MMLRKRNINNGDLKQQYDIWFWFLWTNFVFLVIFVLFIYGKVTKCFSCKQSKFNIREIRNQKLMLYRFFIYFFISNYFIWKVKVEIQQNIFDNKNVYIHFYKRLCISCNLYGYCFWKTIWSIKCIIQMLFYD